MISCTLTFRLPSPLLPWGKLIRRRHVTANSSKCAAVLPGHGGAGSSHIAERRRPGEAAERSGARRYPGLYRAGPGRRSAPWLTESRRRRRVPLRQLHVKSPGPPRAPRGVREGGGTRLPGTAARRGLPAASRHRDVSTLCCSLSLSYSLGAARTVSLWYTFCQKMIGSQAGSSLFSLQEHP